MNGVGACRQRSASVTDAGDSGENRVDRRPRVRHHRDMRAGHVSYRGARALRHVALPRHRRRGDRSVLGVDRFTDLPQGVLSDGPGRGAAVE
jgi:hypothetical protein